MESYTEGWAAAMVAVAMSMETVGGDNALAALTQSSRDIEEYLHARCSVPGGLSDGPLPSKPVFAGV
ncbi:hypothetical protein Desor_2464 [Desulfosporosinus orientis DSM 765]|uniref:Uncharacterized protein n=1 Tax=Desulfosporosinus orientis (strain ATCC 19365 / DSM 765 / NCIMB 8382 / VKM B-1628 / Singapore I) TaxID=768706 RepID=G7WGF4_DESOD|nr:hypothetical protein [Desulfosporosinus orientis]AET68031.1 hypothetical protein Desor_2464 [Desulfosporosinus orientis DSM 765]